MVLQKNMKNNAKIQYEINTPKETWCCIRTGETMLRFNMKFTLPKKHGVA